MQLSFTRLQVFNSSSILIILSLVLAAGCKPERFPPCAHCSVFPSIGDTTVWFEFDACESVNNQGFSSGLSFRWDFNDDGVWDTDWRDQGTTAHRFHFPGTYRIVVEVSDSHANSDTASVLVSSFGRNTNISVLIDSRDGKEYSVALFRNNWWMRENLEHGKVIDLTQMQSDNGVVEQYYGFYSGSADTVFGIYDWREAMDYHYNNPHGICPPGWHIPTIEEWKSLLEGFPPYYAIEFYGRDGLSELHLHMGTYLSTSRPEVDHMLWAGMNRFWASDFEWVNSQNVQIGAFGLTQAQEGDRYLSQIWVGTWKIPEIFKDLTLVRGHSIRCIKKAI